jgi:hypothetical protein
MAAEPPGNALRRGAGDEARLVDRGIESRGRRPVCLRESVEPVAERRPLYVRELMSLLPRVVGRSLSREPRGHPVDVGRPPDDHELGAGEPLAARVRHRQDSCLAPASQTVRDSLGDLVRVPVERLVDHYGVHRYLPRSR